MKSMLRAIFRFFFKVELNLSEKASNTEGIIVCNHQSFLDGLLLGLFLPQAPLFVIDKAIAKRWYFRIPLKFIDHVTIDSQHPMSIKYLVEKAKEGRSIVVFPEGRITLTGSFMKFYEGSAFVAYRANVPLIPVYLEGAEFTFFGRLKGLVKRRFFTPIKITMADPLTITVPENLMGRERRQYLSDYTHKLFMDFRVACYEPDTLFASFLKARNEFGGDRICADDISRKPKTYNRFITESIAIGQLLSHHTSPKERVGVLLPNATITAETIMGLSAFQRTPAMLNYTAGIKGMGAAISAAEIKTIITSRRFVSKANLGSIVEAFSDLNWVYAEDLKSTITLNDRLEIVKKRLFPSKYLPQLSPESEAVILFTSGSEGLPKGVVHTHRSLLTNVEQIRTVADFTAKDKFMITLPLFHAFGLTVGTILPFMTGSQVYYYPSPLHYRVIPEVIYEIQATVLFGTSTFLLNYAKRGNPYDFSSLRYVVAGAERLSEETRKIWNDKIGQRILEGYGVTECAPVIAINVPMNYKQGTVGKMLPGIDAKLLKVDGIKDGGELVVRAGNVMAGYLFADNPGVVVKPELNGETGWHKTGDIVTMDERGFVSIQGRAKRFAKIAGEMVSLEVVETLLQEAYPEMAHAAVVRHDSKRGEAIVVFTTQKSPKRQMLLEIAQKLGINELAIPRDFRELMEIPLLGSGKINYPALSAML